MQSAGKYFHANQDGYDKVCEMADVLLVYFERDEFNLIESNEKIEKEKILNDLKFRRGDFEYRLMTTQTFYSDLQTNLNYRPFLDVFLSVAKSSLKIKPENFFSKAFASSNSKGNLEIMIVLDKLLQEALKNYHPVR